MELAVGNRERGRGGRKFGPVLISLWIKNIAIFLIIQDAIEMSRVSRVKLKRKCSHLAKDDVRFSIVGEVTLRLITNTSTYLNTL